MNWARPSLTRCPRSRTSLRLFPRRGFGRWPTGEEIGDLCTGSRGTFTDGGASYSINPLWLNSKSACNAGDFSRAPNGLGVAALAQLRRIEETRP